MHTKPARFRALAREENIRTGRQLAEELAQPYLPLINDIVMTEQGLRRFNAEAEETKKAAREIGFTGVILPGGRVGKITRENRAAAFRRIRRALEG